MKILTGDTYKLNGACQYGYTRDGQKVTIEPYETIIKIRENFWDRVKLRNMWRIFGTFTEVDIDSSIIDRYFTKQEKIRMRDATKEELETVDNYIKNISEPTGVNFFDENNRFEKLKNVLMEYFDINNDTYAYNLTRDKKAFSVGTMSFEDFEEFSEETIDDIVRYVREKI